MRKNHRVSFDVFTTHPWPRATPCFNIIIGVHNPSAKRSIYNRRLFSFLFFHPESMKIEWKVTRIESTDGLASAAARAEEKVYNRFFHARTIEIRNFCRITQNDIRPCVLLYAYICSRGGILQFKLINKTLAGRTVHYRNIRNSGRLGLDDDGQNGF